MNDRTLPITRLCPQVIRAHVNVTRRLPLTTAATGRYHLYVALPRSTVSLLIMLTRKVKDVRRGDRTVQLISDSRAHTLDGALNQLGELGLEDLQVLL